MSSLLERVKSIRNLSKPVVIQEHQTYQLLSTDSEHLIKKIAGNFPSAEKLINEIESLFNQGILAEAYFIELMVNREYEKDLKKFKERINIIYSKIVNIYVDTMISLDKDSINR